MMNLAVIVALLVGQSVEECPSLLVAKGLGGSPQARAYADCMARPWLPTAAELASKKQQCAVAPDPKIFRAISWVDTIATNFPGCEIRLEFKKK